MKNARCLILTLIFACGATALASTPDQAGMPEGVRVIFAKNCSVVGCHQGRYPTQGLNLDPSGLPASALDKPSAEVPGKKIIDSADPEKSYLLAKIKGGPGIAGERMPEGRDPLSAEEVNAVEGWLMTLKGTSARAGVQATPMARPARFAKPAFWGTRIINLPTARTIDKGHLLFRISHRFIPPVSIGEDGFYGLDGPAFILLSFGYAVTDRLMVTLGRGNHDQEWEFYGSYRLFESASSFTLPLAGALHIGGSAVSVDKPSGAQWSGRFRFSALFSLSCQVTDRVSLLVVPGYASNTNYQQPNSDGTFSLGLGGRVIVFDDFSVIGEWVPVLAGYKDFVNGWGLGVEKKIGGHVFQVFVTNCFGLPAAQFLVGGELGRYQTGFFDKFRLGFNIFRTF